MRNLALESYTSYCNYMEAVYVVYANIFKVQRAWTDRLSWTLEPGIMSEVAAINANVLSIYADALGRNTHLVMQLHS